MVKLKDGFTGERALVLPRIIVDKMEEDPLTSMLHITDIGYYPKAKYHFRERKEPINQYVFIYCIDGAGWYRIGNQEYTVSANQYFILPAGVPHAYASDKSSPWTIYWIRDLLYQFFFHIGKKFHRGDLDFQLILPPLLGLATGLDIQERAFIEIPLISHPVISPERYFRRARITIPYGLPFLLTPRRTLVTMPPIVISRPTSAVLSSSSVM